MIDAKQCEKHSRMEEARTKINDGAKFDEVAREYSEDKARQGERIGLTVIQFDTYSTGGSLGWQTKGGLAPEFEKVAFELETSTTAKPKIGYAKTSFG